MSAAAKPFYVQIDGEQVQAWGAEDRRSYCAWAPFGANRSSPEVVPSPMPLMFGMKHADQRRQRIGKILTKHLEIFFERCRCDRYCCSKYYCARQKNSYGIERKGQG